MACLDLRIRTIPPGTVSIKPVPPGQVVARPVPPGSVAVDVKNDLKVSATVLNDLKVIITPRPQAKVTVTQVCSTSVGGTFLVLAASDGILRTSDGGYLLLDPAREDEE
jgi:hypothetical protein